MTTAWRRLASTPLGILFLTFPGVFLPLDLIYAGPWIMAYATWQQAARIFLSCVGIALLASILVCAAFAAVPVLRRRALAASLTLMTLAVLYGFLLWTQYFSYSEDFQWMRQAAVVLISLAAGPFLARRLGKAQVQPLAAIARSATGVIAVIALGAIGLLIRPDEEPTPSAIGSRNAEHPPIFLITIDTLSALYIPMYGYDRPTAPRLAEFAQGATVFERNYANSNFTTAGVASLMYGMRPWTHRAVQLEGQPLASLASSSLPAMLKGAGYFTAAVATNGWAAPSHLGLTRYFSAVSQHNLCAVSDPALMLPTDAQVAIKSSLVARTVHSLLVWAADRLALCEGRHYDPRLAFREARRLLGERPAGGPFFLWVHLFPPHDPYVAAEPFVGTFAPAPQARDRASTTPPYLFEARDRLDFPGLLLMRYLESIREVDYHIGAFLDELKKDGLYDRSLIVVTADHGESFSKFYGHHGGPGLHEDLVRVPLLIKQPGQAAHQEVRELSEQADLLPTLLELAGVAQPSRREGVSLVPALRGERLERPVFTMNFQQAVRLGPLDSGTVAMVEGRWKYVHYFGNFHYPEMPRLADELYDLRADPHELSNDVAARPEVVERMRKQTAEMLAAHGGRIR